MKKQLLLSFILISTFTSTAFAYRRFNRGSSAYGLGPCKQIEQSCLSAGFFRKDWKNGNGLWKDCVNPIMQGLKTVPGGTKHLPIVDLGTIAACKAQNPKFGQSSVGSK